MSQSLPDPDIEDRTEYDAMLDDLDVAIDEARRKIESGRVRSPEHDKVRIKLWRCMAYLIRSRAKVREKQQIEEIADRLEEIEERQNADTSHQ